MRLVLFFSALLGIFVFPLILSAQPIGFDLHGIYAYDFDGDMGSFGKSDYDDVPGGGASFFFALVPQIRFDIGADWIKTKNKDLDNSHLAISPLTVGLRAGMPLDKFYFYLGGGVGYAIYRLQLTGAASRNLAAQGVYEPSVTDDITYFATLGAEMAVSRHIGFRVEYRYSWMRTEFKYDDYLGNDEEEDLNLDHQEIRAGMLVYF